MKIKAIWASDNPFIPDPTRLEYSKTIEVPGDMDMEQLKIFAVEDSREGYHFKEFQILPNSGD